MQNTNNVIVTLQPLTLTAMRFLSPEPSLQSIPQYTSELPYLHTTICAHVQTRVIYPRLCSMCDLFITTEKLIQTQLQ
jgi:hypothetical protein